jgi:hypothetical protein
MVSKLSQYDPNCSSRIWIPDPDFLPIPDPGSSGQKAPYFRSRIRKTVGLLVEHAPHSPLNIRPDYPYLHGLLLKTEQEKTNRIKSGYFKKILRHLWKLGKTSTGQDLWKTYSFKEKKYVNIEDRMIFM